MPSKKKKFNARFPPARIKKIMQKDEEVGKVASTVPVMISRLLELFTESLILKTSELTALVNARTLTTSHLKQVILSEKKFEFLKDLVAHIPDVQLNETDGGDSNSDPGIRSRPRGRPRKQKSNECTVPKKRGRKPKALQPSMDELAEENSEDDLETEDADSFGNEDVESTDEDTNCDKLSAEASLHCLKKRRVNSSEPGTSSHHANKQSCVVRQGSKADGEASASGSLMMADDCRRDEGGSSIFNPWNSVKTAECGSRTIEVLGDSCLPLNLKTVSSYGDSSGQLPSGSDFQQDTESYLMQQPSMGMNVGKLIKYQASTSGGFSQQEPPPAHQPLGQGLIYQQTLSCVGPSSGKTAPPCPNPSEVLPHGVSSSDLMVHSATSLTASNKPSVNGLPAASHAAPDCPTQATLSATTSVNFSGFAFHRMPPVPVSFPGTVLARSTSLPHSGGTSRQSSLVTSPDDDYDS